MQRMVHYCQCCRESTVIESQRGRDKGFEFLGWGLGVQKGAYGQMEAAGLKVALFNKYG